jgi:outer membrane protein OmpA-like peptidoglycan-associated protein
MKNINNLKLIKILFLLRHTDNMGKKSYNQQLSKRRAKTVQKVLIAQGINPEQLVIKAFGENNPIATNTTSQGRQQNRRVEIVILKKGIIP